MTGDIWLSSWVFFYFGLMKRLLSVSLSWGVMFFFCEVSRDRPFVLLKGEEPRCAFSESGWGVTISNLTIPLAFWMLPESQKDSSHSTFVKHVLLVLPWWSSGKESTFQCRGLGFDPFSGNEHPMCHCVKKRKKKKGFLPSHPGGKAGGNACNGLCPGITLHPPPSHRTCFSWAAASHLRAQPAADCSRLFSHLILVSVYPLLSEVF